MGGLPSLTHNTNLPLGGAIKSARPSPPPAVAIRLCLSIGRSVARIKKSWGIRQGRVGWGGGGWTLMLGPVARWREAPFKGFWGVEYRPIRLNAGDSQSRRNVLIRKYHGGLIRLAVCGL